jgi:hypothetical protein
MGLSAIAVVIAIVALILNLAVPGPLGAAGAPGTNGTNGTNGATGPRGPSGPPGPGSLMNSTRSTPWQSGGLGIVGCTNIHAVTLTVPSAGNVVMTSTVHVWIDHTTGTADTFAIHQATDPADCSDATTNRIRFMEEVSDAAPTDSFINLAGTVVTAFPISGAGTYTFDLNINMYSGQNAGDRVSEAESVVVFYPS